MAGYGPVYMVINSEGLFYNKESNSFGHQDDATLFTRYNDARMKLRSNCAVIKTHCPITFAESKLDRFRKTMTKH